MKSPVGSTHPLAVVSKNDSACPLSGNVTVFDWPGASITRWKPSSWRAGSPVEAGSPRYSCATSAPARVPVFLTVAVTVSSVLPWPPSGPEVVFWTCAAESFRPEYLKLVYERPNPNGNSGVTFSVS